MNRSSRWITTLAALVLVACTTVQPAPSATVAPSTTAVATPSSSEPMGGGLNFWDDVRFVRLDGLPVPMQVGVSTRYWQKAGADDPRLTIEPDIRVEVLAADYFGHRDPGLEAVLGAP